ncbi:MAG: ATP-binding protein [Treponema sp.]|nr:ATP-binding protein [Treponema sp.]
MLEAMGDYDMDSTVIYIATPDSFLMLVGMIAVILLAVTSLSMVVVILRRVKTTMEKEREVHKMNELFLDSSPFVMSIWDDNYTIVDASHKSVEMFGLTDQKQYIERFFDLSPEYQPCGTNSREKVLGHLKEAFRKGHDQFEWMHQTLRGEPLPTEVALARFKRRDKYVVAAYTVALRLVRTSMERELDANDMTQMIQETLPVLTKKKSEANGEIQMALDALPMFIEIWNDNLDIIGCNQQALDVFALPSKEEYIDRYYEFSPALQPSGRPSYKNAVGYIETALREGISQFEWMHQKPNGEELLVEVTCVRIRRNGKPVIVAYNHDLRHVKAVMKTVMKKEREAEDQIKFLLDSAPMSCYLLDTKYRAVDCNQAAIDLFVKEPGKSPTETYPEEKDFAQCKVLNCKTCVYFGDGTCSARKYLIRNYRRTFLTYEQNKEQIERLIAGGCEKSLQMGVYRYEIPTVTLYGDIIPCEVTIVPIKLRGGYGFAVYRRDLREEQRRKAAEEESMAKTRFLARMSHEIRTPMNAIIGMAELALRSEKIDVAREHIVTVKQAGTSLLSIINDILDISKVEQGKLEIVTTNYHFSSLLNDVLSIIRVKIMDAHLRFIVKVDSRIPNSLSGDEVRIRQVMLNLLGNAVKYTKSGGFVSLTIHGKIVDEDTVNLTVHVEDSGIGIKEEDQKTLFEEYSRFDMEQNKNAEGTGLGLAIAWHIVKAMDGKIDVSSEYGKGSTFTVSFSQKVRFDKPIGFVKNAGKKSALLYEKRDLYANSMLFALNSLGVENMQASDNDDLFEKLTDGKYTYAFVSFDMYRKNAKALAEMKTPTKIVILTEFGETIPEKNLAVLSMPVHSLSVANILNGGQDKFSYSKDTIFAASFTAPEAHVLVVDDVLTNLKVVKGLLVPYGMEVSLCKNGKMALNAIKANRYDIIFMDHLMPDMDGVETTKQIRGFGAENAYFAEMPIVALTANVISGMREFFLKNGFNDFMSKPVDVVNLNSILKKWIPKEKQVKL